MSTIINVKKFGECNGSSVSRAAIANLFLNNYIGQYGKEGETSILRWQNNAGAALTVVTDITAIGYIKGTCNNNVDILDTDLVIFTFAIVAPNTSYKVRFKDDATGTVLTTVLITKENNKIMLDGCLFNKSPQMFFQAFTVADLPVVANEIYVESKVINIGNI